MSIQMMFLGNSASSQITAQSVFVGNIRSDSASVSASFRSNGQQTTQRFGSTTVVGNWVIPTTTATDWEIRTILVSGDTPTGAALNTWLALSTSRSWSLSSTTDNERLECELTFEFRRVGGGSAEVIITGSTLAAEVLGAPF